MMCTSIYFRRNYLANVVDSINLDARFDIIYGMCIPIQYSVKQVERVGSSD